MLIDLHAHSSGISLCCKIPYEQVLAQTLDNGMDGIVLTNHYKKCYHNCSAEELAEKYTNEFYAAEQWGSKIGCKVFFGIEVTMILYPNVELLIYGVAPEFLKENPRIFDCTQEELYRLVKNHNGVLVQAHPFRNGASVLNPAFLDGVEINCHPAYGRSYAKELLEIAEKERLIVTCGGDYHADTYRPKCGMFLPDHIKDHGDLGTYLLSDAEKKLHIQEPNCDTYTIISV